MIRDLNHKANHDKLCSKIISFP